jgi:hypothetical protein
MAYEWIGENWGRSMIFDACKAGFTVKIRSEGDTLYLGTEPKKAWDAALGVDDCHVCIRKDPNEKWEVAVLIFEYGQRGDEVIADHSVGGWIEKWWDEKYETAA